MVGKEISVISAIFVPPIHVRTMVRVQTPDLDISVPVLMSGMVEIATRNIIVIVSLARTVESVPILGTLLYVTATRTGLEPFVR